MSQEMLRQGDVGLIRMSGAPTNVELVPEKRRLIRKGEHGGVHELETLDKARLYSVLDEANQVVARYIEVTEPTRVVHKEHNPIDLEPGWYQVSIQREFFQNRVRYTAD